jgi:uncharacterized membrane protein YebE (DUF533 family)
MFDALKLLGSLAQTSAAPSAGNRFGAAMNQTGSGNPLEQLMAQFGGMGTQPGAQPGGGLGGMLGGFAEMAKNAMTSPQQEVRNNNPAAMGGLGALAGALLGGGGGAMGGGMMGVLGSLAFSALQSQNSASTSAAPQTGGGFEQASYTKAYSSPMPANPADVQRRAILMIRAMIQAAKADGKIDAQETQRIMGKLTEFGHDDQARAFVNNEMSRPIDIAGLVRDVQSPQEAGEVYAASLMAIEVDSQPERYYLTDLAAALKLPVGAMSQINGALGVRV